MGATSLIPTFKPGQKALLHYRAYEMRCPKCGRIFGTLPSKHPWFEPIDPYVAHAVIVQGAISEVECSDCQSMVKVNGFYGVHLCARPTVRVGVPYTLLSPIEEGAGED